MEFNEELGRLQNILQDELQYQLILQQTGENAQLWLDFLQLAVDHPSVSAEFRSSIFMTMIRLSKTCRLYPKCLAIRNVRKMGNHPVAGGGFGDVWKGTIGGASENIVCLKVSKVYLTSDAGQLFKDYLREAIVWRQLKHPNLLPFLGVYHLDDNRHQFCLVSPWMENGNLVQFTKDNLDIPYYSLVHDVAAGLAYLHSKKIVHGDLKGVNILISPDRRACIADFGLSRVVDATNGLRFLKSTTRPAGTARWLAPELLIGDERTSESSDIYAFGGVCYEIFSGRVPFYELPNDAAVVFHVFHGRRPVRPDGIAELHDVMWGIMETCWSADPTSRLAAGDIMALLVELDTLDIFRPASDWEEGIFTEEIWSNLRYPSYDVQDIDALLKSVESRGEMDQKQAKEPKYGRLCSAVEHSSPVHEDLSDQFPSPSQLSSEYDPFCESVQPGGDEITNLLSEISITKESSPSHHRLTSRSPSPTSAEEDVVSGLTEECKIGWSSAITLGQALSGSMPEQLEVRKKWKSFLKEYHSRCLSSHEIISSRIPWAIANVERSLRTVATHEAKEEDTNEGKLLAILLDVNEMLERVVEQYDYSVV
ncbi:hypothetical protein E1B28_004673 [Marasmius oreades]|uniref:Protein kinase domain-containing protein n=1 Tax=Marasmius oreades TaxID=181124 RepID=A0A9P7UZ46_9AGAR|nr:uncharacterized protein E1B28_004673 [Marasmius oreades]KAG7097312.1 hypothetical protein E1B28_004673 [Marasmius oreades]